jgi:hypothetical protein
MFDNNMSDYLLARSGCFNNHNDYILHLLYLDTRVYQIMQYLLLINIILNHHWLEVS